MGLFYFLPAEWFVEHQGIAGLGYVWILLHRVGEEILGYTIALGLIH